MITRTGLTSVSFWVSLRILIWESNCAIMSNAQIRDDKTFFHLTHNSESRFGDLFSREKNLKNRNYSLKYFVFRWVVIFSHPADFTPVCTTELGRIAVHHPHFVKRNTKLLAHSVDKLGDHVHWVNVSGSSNFIIFWAQDEIILQKFRL